MQLALLAIRDRLDRRDVEGDQHAVDGEEEGLAAVVDLLGGKMGEWLKIVYGLVNR